MPRPPQSGDPLRELSQGTLGSLYFIYGKERFLVDRAVDVLRQRVLTPATRDFNYELFQGKEASAARIVQAARTLPMMAPRRLVLVRDADEIKADELTAIIPYLAQPCQESCVVFVAEKVDQRLKFFTAFKKNGQLLKFDPLYDRQLPGFAAAEAEKRGVYFDAGAAELLAGEVGADLGQLADAVERLTVYLGERRSISVADIETVIASTRQRNVFELSKAIGEGQRENALRILHSMLVARESGVRIVAMLVRHLRQLWMTAELLAQRLGKMDIAQEIGIPPFFVDEMMVQAKRFDRHSFERMHRALFVADRALKSSRLDEARLLEQLILTLTRPLRNPPARRTA